MAGAVAMWASAAAAQDMCSAYVGHQVTPKTIDAAIAPFSKITVKSEFETTAEFEARRASAVAGVVGTVVIAKEPEDLQNLQYDADTRKLRVIAWVFHNKPFNPRSAFSSAGLQEKMDLAAGGYIHPGEFIHVVVSSVDTPKGTYQATNSYGAETQVQKIHRVTKVIFDRTAKDAMLFPSADKSPYVVGELELSPEDARRLKPTLKLAFVVTPKEPFLVKGTHKPFEVTIRDPRDLTEDFSILVADIQCGLVTDAGNRVLAAYPTR